MATRRRPQSLAVVVEDYDRGILAIHLCSGWRETLQVVRECAELDYTSERVYVCQAESVECNWRHGSATAVPANRAARSARRRAQARKAVA